MRWVIHIGAPKTGSTAIQRVLCENREQLLAHKIHYPDVSLRGNGHHDLAFLLYGRYADWATPQDRPLSELRIALRDAVQTIPATTVVLSSENFSLYPQPAALRDLLETAGLKRDDEICVVCYARRQDDAHISWYNQSVKAQGNALGFEDTVRLTRDLWNYSLLLKPWRDEFGAEAILLRDYTPFGRQPNDIRADFLEILGLSPSQFHLPAARENERINRDILEVQRWVNRLPLSHRQKRRFHKQLIELTSASANLQIFDDTPFLDFEGRKALLQSYAEDNKSVARAYLNREALFAAVEDSTVMRPAPVVRQGLTLTKLFHILLWLVGRGLPGQPRRS